MVYCGVSHRKVKITPVMHHARLAVALGVVLCCITVAHGQPGAVTASEQVFERVMAEARRTALHEASLGSIMREVGLQLRGAPYAAGLLDKPGEEELVVDLTQFDCVLYVEVVLAMALGVALHDHGFGSFKERLRSLRYRAGRMDGYCSRLHYFTEWIRDNEARGHVHDITRSIGGVPLEKVLNFMSRHRDSYPRLAQSDSLFRGILEMERSLVEMALFHIPQDQIRLAYGALRDGDILAMSTSVEGLDVTHTGLAYAQPDGSFGMLHASTSGGVMVSPDLADYVRANSVQAGIIVARPVDPRHTR